MNKPVDPKNLGHSEPLDLASYQAMTISDHTPSLLDRAVASGPQPVAFKVPDFLARQVPDDEERGWAAKLFQRKPKEPIPEGPADPAKRRTLKHVAYGAAAVATGGGLFNRYVVNGRTPYNLALLKMDKDAPDGPEMGIIHRTIATDDIDGMVDPSRNTYQNLGKATMADDGLESLVVSPDLGLEALDRERNPKNPDAWKQHPHDKQEIVLDHVARNIFIPYHLFANAARFTISKRIEQEIVPDDGAPLNEGERIENINGERVKVVLHPRLQISIFGRNEAEDVPIAMDIGSAVTNTKDNVGDIVSGIGSTIANGWDYIWGNDDKAKARITDREDAIRQREQAKPHYQVTPKFIITMDYLDDAHLPDLHFYDASTYAAPSMHVLRESIAKGLAHKPVGNELPGYHIITNNGLSCDAFTNNGVCVPQGIRFTDRSIAKAAHDAQLLRDSMPTDGLITKLKDKVMSYVGEDNKLNANEMNALILAAGFLQHGEDLRYSNWLERARFKLSQEPDRDVGR